MQMRKAPMFGTLICCSFLLANGAGAGSVAMQGVQYILCRELSGCCNTLPGATSCQFADGWTLTFDENTTWLKASGPEETRYSLQLLPLPNAPNFTWIGMFSYDSGTQSAQCDGKCEGCGSLQCGCGDFQCTGSAETKASEVVNVTKLQSRIAPTAIQGPQRERMPANSRYTFCRGTIGGNDCCTTEPGSTFCRTANTGTGLNFDVGSGRITASVAIKYVTQMVPPAQEGRPWFGTFTFSQKKLGHCALSCPWNCCLPIMSPTGFSGSCDAEIDFSANEQVSVAPAVSMSAVAPPARPKAADAYMEANSRTHEHSTIAESMSAPLVQV